MTVPPRTNVLGVGIHALDLEGAVAFLVAAAQAGRTGYVCCCDVNSLSCARRDPAHRARLNRALLATPDGMPVVWLARCGDYPGIDRVYGPDLLLALSAATAGTGIAHYFYGGTEGTAGRLAASLRERFPALEVAGVRTPPFDVFPPEERDAVADEINRSGARLVWVGVSTPKQERLMAELAPRLTRAILIGVGAAFDLHSGRIRQAPRWLQRSGLEWFWRVCLEPRRLGPRYLRNNPLFLLRAFAQLSGLRHYPLDEPERAQKSSP